MTTLYDMCYALLYQMIIWHICHMVDFLRLREVNTLLFQIIQIL